MRTSTWTPFVLSVLTPGIIVAVLLTGGCLAAPGQGRGGQRADGPPPPPGGGPPPNQTFDMTRTLSDRAQLHTIAFSGFASNCASA